MTIPPPPWRTPRARPKRRRPLTQDRIVDVALDLMRKEGYDAVSMRRLAQALGTGPASLYAHVENRRELDQLVVDRVIDPDLVPDPDPEHWQEQLLDLMRAMREMYRRYPGVARASMAMVPTGPSALRTIERMLNLLLAAGIPPQIAAWACDLIALYVAAGAHEQELWRSETGDDEDKEAEYFVEQLRGYLASLPPKSFPTVVGMATVLTTGDDDDRFTFGAQVIITGIATLAAAEHSEAGSPKTT